MIIKTLIVFATVFGLYSLIVILNPSMSATQHQWQDNVVRAEKYIYNENDTVANLIVGSSLAQRLINDSLPNFYNLALAGQSIFEGLEIITHRKKLPRNIFIETNLVFKEWDKKFSANIFWPLTFNVKKYCPSLRSDKQPLVFIYPILKNAFGKIEASVPAPANSRENEIFNSMMNLQIAKYSKIPDSAFTRAQFSVLTKLVTDLKSKGVNIIFFEMPLNPNLVELPLAKFIRRKFFDYFPQTENNYIEIPDCSAYITGDGLHLNYRESIAYTLYFKEQAKKYKP